MQIRCNANLFRIAYLTVSTEETRYYLQGVYVAPREAGGVVMVSTDGHRLTAVFDAEGTADRAAIVKLPKDVLKACKPVREDVRTLSVELAANAGAGKAVATVLQRPHEAEPEHDVPVAIAHDAEIDGTFPNYRRVVPQGGKPIGAEAFNGVYLQDLIKIGGELRAANGASGREVPMVVSGTGEGSPAIVRWSGVENGFSVLMPMRITFDHGETPGWFA